MAKTSYIDIPAGLQAQFLGTLKSGDRYTIPRIIRSQTILSRKRKKGITQRSLLPQIAAAWQALSDQERTDWTTAAAFSGMRGYTLFVKDKALRIINEMAGNATPSILHQAKVGELKIEAPAEEIQIYQAHPKSYWLDKPVYGKKGMRTQVMITEDLVLPLEISLSYKSDLTSTGGGSFAKFYAIIKRLYQGLTINVPLEINLDLQTDWKTASAELTEVLGQYTNYALYIHLYKVRGSLWIDNPKAEHSSQNWIRDPYCNDINQGFTKAFYQIPKHWAAVEIPEGSAYESVYPTD